jgi:hypothetical protein
VWPRFNVTVTLCHQSTTPNLHTTIYARENDAQQRLDGCVDLSVIYRSVFDYNQRAVI